MLVDESEVVPDGLACTRCGESWMDYLAMRDDDSVECQTCGEIYSLPEVPFRVN